MLNKQIVFVTGLPYSGSSLLCQLLRAHPEIYSPEHRSPLCQSLVGLRRQLSESQALANPGEIHELGVRSPQRDLEAMREMNLSCLNALRGFVAGWFAAVEPSWVVDAHPDWLKHLELIRWVNPQGRLVVCVRELSQIYGAIEADLQKFPFLDLPEQFLGELSKADRARKLFADDGYVGTPLKAIESFADLEYELQQQIYYVVFEHLVRDPREVLEGLWHWLGVPPGNVDLKSVMQQLGDRSHVVSPADPALQAIPTSYHAVPPRFKAAIKRNFRWFYENFYPGQLP